MMTRAELRCRYIELCKACGLNETGDDALSMILEPAMRVELMECEVSSLQELKALAEKNAAATSGVDRIMFLICNFGITIEDYSELREIALSGAKRGTLTLSTKGRADGYKLVIFNCWRE